MITLQGDERILMEVRKHWLGIATHAVALLVLTIVPIVLAPFVLQYFFDTVFLEILLFAGPLWVWFMWVMFFVMWTNYYLDVLVITTTRLIDKEQFVLFSRDEVIVPLASVEDIKIEVKGVLATLLGFGNIQIQSAGAARETVAKNIRNPEAVRACIAHAIESLKQGI